MARKRSPAAANSTHISSDICLMVAKGKVHQGNATVHKRGLCASCFRAAARVVREGETWEQLEADGLALPDEPANRTPFFRAYSEVRRARVAKVKQE